MRYATWIYVGPTVVLTAVVLLGRQVEASAQQGGTGGAGGLGGADMSPADPEQIQLVRPRPPHPLSAAAARTWLKLDQPTAVPFDAGTTLAEVVRFLGEATRDKAKDSNDDGVEVYVDPVGLQEAEKTLESPVRLRVKAVPLATSLKLMLEQIGLAYYVQEDGLITITADVTTGPDFPRRLSVPISAAAATAWLRLGQSADLTFEGAVPLSQVLRTIKDATKLPDGSELSFYVDPISLSEAEKSMESPITIDLKKVPVSTALTLVTRQLGMAYRVQEDGIIMIVVADGESETLPEGHGPETIAHLRAQLQEAKLQAQIAQVKAQMGIAGPGGGGFQSSRAR